MSEQPPPVRQLDDGTFFVHVQRAAGVQPERIQRVLDNLRSVSVRTISHDSGPL